MLHRSTLKSVLPHAGGVAITLVAVAVSGLFVSAASHTAFQETPTVRSGDVVTAGPISLTNDSSAGLFGSDRVAPGFTESHCITITSHSDASTTLKMYSSGVSSTGASGTLSQNLNMRIIRGSNSTDQHCTGFVAEPGEPAFVGTLDSFSTATDYKSGLGAHSLPANSSSQYKITVSVPNDASIPQNSTATADFVWEAQG